MTKHKLGFRALGKDVIFTEKPKKDVSVGGIVLPSNQETSAGIVVATGPEVTQVELGETIYLNWAKAEKHRLNNTDYYKVSEDEIVLAG